VKRSAKVEDEPESEYIKLQTKIEEGKLLQQLVDM
jgi:hypothetical protein